MFDLQGSSDRFRMIRLMPIVLGLTLTVTAVCDSQEVDYLQQIKPILAEKCFACHGALKQESGLRLDAISLIRTGGDDGPVIVAGKADESLLLEKVAAADADDRMPPAESGDPLSPEQIALLKAWIDGGAKAPVEAIPPDPRVHWAYQLPVRPAIPKIANADWPRNDIDRFIAAAHEQRGLTAVAETSKSILLRRVYLDLIGLPPTQAELKAFLADDSTNAYEKVVDRLLDSKQYGERWARHWMDVWRYSDGTGYGDELRYSQKHIWRWRDWIVESLNADKPYDRMIVEMLAGDEIAADDENVARATGFLARNWYKFDRNSWLDDTVEHTTKAFLGMTLNCARCHDHKYDPVSQVEYYRFRAIFEPYNVRIDQVPGQVDVARDGLVRVYDADASAATHLFTRGDPKRPDSDHPLEPGVPSIVKGPQFKVEPVTLPLKSYYPSIRDFVGADLIKQQQDEVTAATASLVKANEELATAAKELVDAKPESNGASATPVQATPQQTHQLVLENAALAECKLATAQARLTAIEARVRAEHAKYQHQLQSSEPAASDAEANRLALLAGHAERLVAVAVANENLLLAEQTLTRATEASQATEELEKQVTDGKTALEDATKASAKEVATYQPLGTAYPQTSTGRRLALARWITDKQNPLTARVAVNHIWLRHFGTPLIENVVDLGLRSDKPAQAELLDYLAVELMENDWSMKKLHRLIVTSSTYRMSSSATAATANVTSDRDNEFLWRMNSRRIEAESVRDAILYLAGALDQTMGGPDLDQNQGLTIPRRSLYFRHARERQMPFLQIFDAANPEECYRRRPSIRPQQVFAMMNSSLSIEHARRLAGKISDEIHTENTSEQDVGANGNDQNRPAENESFIVIAFETLLTREPNESEMAACREFLQLQANQLSEPQKLELLDSADNRLAASTDPAQRARENLVLVLFNHNDFVTVR